MAAERQLRVDALLQAGEVLLAEAGLLEPSERLLELGQRRAAPQGERAPQRRGGLLRAPACQRLAPRRVERPEGAQVERVAVEVEAVPGRTRLDQPRWKLLAEERDEDLHHLRRARRDILAPEVVDEAVHRNDAVRVKKQQCQQGSLLAARQLDGTGVVHRLERPEHSEVHAPEYRRSLRGRPLLRRRSSVARAPAADRPSAVGRCRACGAAPRGPESAGRGEWTFRKRQRRVAVVEALGHGGGHGVRDL